MPDVTLQMCYHHRGSALTPTYLHRFTQTPVTFAYQNPKTSAICGVNLYTASISIAHEQMTTPICGDAMRIRPLDDPLSFIYAGVVRAQTALQGVSCDDKRFIAIFHTADVLNVLLLGASDTTKCASSFTCGATINYKKCD